MGEAAVRPPSLSDLPSAPEFAAAHSGTGRVLGLASHHDFQKPRHNGASSFSFHRSGLAGSRTLLCVEPYKHSPFLSAVLTVTRILHSVQRTQLLSLACLATFAPLRFSLGLLLLRHGKK